MMIETERLLLREMMEEDFTDLHAILSDAETMRFYPKPYDEAGVRRWIAWCRESYAKQGFGLWAVIRKADDAFIGDCGISMQPIHGQWLPEVGYHIRKDCWRQGYASEAAAACIRVGFEQFGFPVVYSYMKSTNEPSYRTAEKNGMTLRVEYDDPVNNRTKVYAITRDEWENRRMR